MKKLILLCIAVAAAVAAPDALAQARIAINHVPFAITKPGNYYLSKNLILTDSTVAINIQADNVDLDLNGRSLSTQTGVGELAAAIAGNGKNILVHHGTIRGFNTGVVLGTQGQGVSTAAQCDGLYITEFAGTNPTGLRLFGDRCSVRNCVVAGDVKFGCWALGLYDRFDGLDVSGSQEAALFIFGSGTVVEHCRFIQAEPQIQGTAIVFGGTAAGNLVSGCFMLNYSDSIFLDSSAETKFRDNTITNCTRTAGTDAGGNR